MLNLDYLKGVASGDESFLKEMMTLFQIEIPKQLTQIREQFDSTDFAGLREKIHKYKATLLTMGMTSTVEAVRRIETECTGEKNVDKIKTDLDHVYNDSKDALAEIGQWLLQRA